MGEFETQILDAAPDAVLLVDGGGTIRYANQTCLELLGYDPATLVGQGVDTLVPEAVRASHTGKREAYGRAPHVRAMRAPGLQTVALTRDGRTLPVDIKLSPLTSGGETLTLAVVRDATERQDFEARLQERNRELDRLNDQRNRFLGILAHDLRSPLTVVRGYSDILLGQRMGALQPAQCEALEQVRESVALMLSLVNDLLDVTTIEEGALHLRLAPTRILQLLERSVQQHRILATEKEQTIEFDAQIGEATVLVDPNRINQVLNNLLSNAIKYSPRGTSIQVTLSEANSEFLVSVRDQGPGIPEEYRPQLFQAYSTSGAQTTGGEKTVGLGLAIVQKIVLGHRGRVWVESTPPQGSVFHVTLPCDVQLGPQAPAGT